MKIKIDMLEAVAARKASDKPAGEKALLRLTGYFDSIMRAARLDNLDKATTNAHIGTGSIQQVRSGSLDIVRNWVHHGSYVTDTYTLAVHFGNAIEGGGLPLAEATFEAMWKEANKKSRHKGLILTDKRKADGFFRVEYPEYNVALHVTKEYATAFSWVAFRFFRTHA